ncbi:SidA/IucD/PvdA family monooxygenase [bacterium]|nr:SidA/IucD/PvdA family monooxygenase [bacterium]
MHHTTDITIIGAGPVGLFAIFEAGMLKMRCHVVDTLDFTGGQCTALYPEKPIYDIPGHPKIDAAELINQLELQAAPFAPTYHLGQQVMGLKQEASGEWTVTTSKGVSITSKAVIIAAGCGAFGPNRPPMEGIEQYEGHSVFYMVKSREAFRDKRVVIAGGGDSAVDWAISLAELAESVQLVHRRPKFRAAPESVSRLDELTKSGKVEMVVPYQLHALEGSGTQISSVIVRTLEGEDRKLEADALLPFFGLAMELGPIADWGLNLEKHHIGVNQTTLETNKKGIFAIGDIAHYPGKLKLILCGFSEAAMAAHAAREVAYPGEVLHFEYSTTKGISGLAA